MKKNIVFAVFLLFSCKEKCELPNQIIIGTGETVSDALFIQIDESNYYYGSNRYIINAEEDNISI
jgi:hypothetical protein